MNEDPKLKTLSFNAWLDDVSRRIVTATGEACNFASVWTSKAGRLTRESVEKRAQLEYGMAPGLGTAVWDEYCRYVKRPIVAKATKEGAPNPPVYTAPAADPSR